MKKKTEIDLPRESEEKIDEAKKYKMFDYIVNLLDL